MKCKLKKHITIFIVTGFCFLLLFNSSVALVEVFQSASYGVQAKSGRLILYSYKVRTVFFCFFFFNFGCVGSSFLCEGFLQLRRAGATLHRGARASHCRGLSYCGAQAPDAQAQQLWLTGPAAPWHVGSSQTRARTRVPCIGRQILNHCATREAR